MQASVFPYSIWFLFVFIVFKHFKCQMQRALLGKFVISFQVTRTVNRFTNINITLKKAALAISFL